MRLWPKAALLILITLWFGFVHAASGPLGERRTEHLRDQLAKYYAVGEPTFGREEVLEADNFYTMAVVPHVLAQVLTHADDPSPAIRELNVQLVAWAAQIALSEGPRHDLVFVMNQVHRQLDRLLERFGDAEEFRVSLLMMFDKLELWGPGQLPFLVREAGHDDHDEAATFGKTAMNVLFKLFPNHNYAELTAGMARTLREVGEMGPWQFALLARSAHITSDELATILMLVSHEYAADVVPPSIATLQPDSPLHDVIMHLMEGYRDGHEVVVDAFEMARDESEAGDDSLTPRIIRRTFFEYFANGTLFGADPADESGTHDEAAGYGVASASVTPSRSKLDLASIERDGNVVRPRFGAGRGCANELE